MILSRVPGVMRLDRSRFRLLICATVVSKSCAMPKSVSPLFTLYVMVFAEAVFVTGSGLACDYGATAGARRSGASTSGAGPVMACEATWVGAAGRLLVAISVAGARGTTNV